MSRLADYFAIIGYDHEKERNGASLGKVFQRFPKVDWPDCPFTQGIELFCQPTGWFLSSQRQQPTYFVSVLTDIDADRHYCACLTFYEPVAMTTAPDDEELDDQEPIIPHHAQMFAPKSLVLITRHDYFETYRNCLGIIYTAYVDKLSVDIETLVGNIIGCVQAPTPGGPQVRFSIGAGDRQALQPPLCSTIPATKQAVAMLFEQLGIHTVLTVFALSLTDHKILFHSQSFSRLTEACHALVSMQYPLKYSYVYIPILPSSLLEVLNTPTPFIAGVHSMHREDIKELLDVVIIDLDGGGLHIPECITPPTIPETILARTMKALHMILHQDLLMSDYAFPPSPSKKHVSLEHKDKEIRSVMVRLIAELLTGYRSCLTLIRIHPEPFITFHKASFLGYKGMVEEDFLVKVLDGMSFNSFVSERGPPYRVCDIFDEVYATMQDHLREERNDSDKLLVHVKDLAHQLHNNENPNPQPYVQKVPKPTEGAYSRIHQPVFPVLDEIKILSIIEDGISKNNVKNKLSNSRPQKRIVPMGPSISSMSDRQKIVDNNARRLEVLRNCVNFIFENKISDARIIFPAVLRALKSKVARISLTQELGHHIQSNRAMLEHQQFDLVVRLLNCALQNDSSMDENGVAASILPLATSFCRKLCTGVIQFAYTLVQEHAVWGNLQFWEASFYQDVQTDIRQLYAPQYEEHIMVCWSKEGSKLRHKLCTGVIQFAYTLVQEHAVWANLQFWEASFYQDVQTDIRQLYAPQYEEHIMKLCTGVIQFAYTLVQEHAVWGNLQFWEASFYQDVQTDIRQLYAPQYEEHIMKLCTGVIQFAYTLVQEHAVWGNLQFWEASFYQDVQTDIRQLMIKLCTGVIQFAYTLVQEHAVWANLQFWEASFYQDVQTDIRQLYAPQYEEHIMKLCTGVIQFAYTLVQEHAVWGNLQFWEASFYQDVQTDIRQLYAPQYEEHIMVRWRKEGSKLRHLQMERQQHEKSNYFPTVPRTTQSMELGSSHDRSSLVSPDIKRRSFSPFRQKEIGALEIAAEQLRIWSTLSEEQQKEMINNEESTVYSQAIHYANRIVYMRVPLDCSKSLKTAAYDEDAKSNSNITASLAESDSVDAESGFDETEEAGNMSSDVIRFVTRFVDKVCSESGVTEDHIKALHQMIPGVVAMHIETLEAVHREAKRLPPIQKPKILTPALLPGEEIVMEGLRVYLLPDGREEGTGVNIGGPALLPAEGAVFLTTYRIIFKGIPCDPLACELVVMRAFPISTLTKEKKLNVQYLSHLNQWLQEGLQLRSNIFQLLKIAFDEEVSSDNVETFRKLVNKCRHPPSVFNTFAFTGHSVSQPATLHKQKEKNKTLRQFAKKAITKTARKAGFKPKQGTSKQKYVLPTPPSGRRSLTPRSSDRSDSESESGRPGSEIYDDLSIVDENEFNTGLTADPKNLEKLLERPGYQDYVRQGLGSLSVIGQRDRSRSEPFRISIVNANFSVCRSYPPLLVVPQSVSDDSIRRFARTHRQSRFPVITWRHPRTKALLLRASSFHSRGLMGMLKHNTAGGTSSGETTSSLEQEKYFSVLVAATPSKTRHASYNTSYSDSLSSLDSLMMSGTMGESLAIPETPDPLRRGQYTTKSSRSSMKLKGASGDFVGLHLSGDATPNTVRRGMFARAVNTLRSSGGKGSNTLSRIGSVKGDKGRTNTLDPARFSHPNGDLDRAGDLINSSVQGLKRVSLYVIGEKAQMKGIKAESFPKCDFIPVDFFEVRHIKNSFKKLMRACVPSSAPGPEAQFMKSIEESGWLPQIQNVLQLSGATVDLLDVQGSSVMICLEDGWDVTSQVVSVAQVLMDPYYRTIEGFRSLVEKEWLGFGHRFTHRSNQTQANQASGFAPVFLQFLDVVHQVHCQFPLSFEFNQYFLKFLAYHYVSNRFRTFMLDTEFERMEAGWLLEEKKPPKLDELDEEAGFSPKHFQQTTMGTTIWDYIDKHHRKTPIFHNFLYSPLDQEVVLRPYSNLSNIRIWDYYTTEDLAHGPSYDIEITQKEIKQNEDTDNLELIGIPQRRVVNDCYDNVLLQQPDYFTAQFQEIHKVEMDLGHLPRKWRIFWDKLESPSRDAVMPRQPSFTMQLARSHGRSIHKRSTLEILVKGKMLGETVKIPSQPHRFEEYTYTTAVYCDLCSNVLWGLAKTGMRCADCGYNCHRNCMESVPKNCTKIKAVSDPSTSSSSISKPSGSDAGSIHGGERISVSTLSSTSHSYDHYTPSSGEHRTHEGYLYKRGALLKGWKQRWFVLDSMKHQMRWYDSMEDSSAKGFIDLSEVETVKTVTGKHVQGAPKKADENAFFEMKTTRRFYSFLAPDGKSAQDWTEKIQSCIQ